MTKRNILWKYYGCELVWLEAVRSFIGNDTSYFRNDLFDQRERSYFSKDTSKRLSKLRVHQIPGISGLILMKLTTYEKPKNLTFYKISALNYCVRKIC